MVCIEHSHKNYLRGGYTSYRQRPQNVSPSIFAFFFFCDKDAVHLRVPYSEQAPCCSTGHMPRVASSVEIIRMSWADSLIATAAWHSCALRRFCRYMHYKLELQDRNTVYLLKRIVLTTIFYYSIVSLGDVSVFPLISRCK